MAAPVESCPETKLSITDDQEDGRINLIQRAQWLRAAILGANDGLLSTTALMLGVGAARDDRTVMIVSGLAGALAGACSMAVGEFVSVSTQRDIEQTINDKCYVKNDHQNMKPQESVVSPVSSPQVQSPSVKVVAMDTRTSRLQESSRTTGDKCNTMSESVEPRESTASPAINLLKESSPHVLSPPPSPFMTIGAIDTLPNPYKAAGASGLAFLCGSVVPLLSAMVFSEKKIRVAGIVIVTSIALAVFGGAGAHLGGSPVRVSAMRVVVGGWISMAVTYGLLMPLDRDHKVHQTSD
ncbi:putative membrane protein [Handroanthus impetiginosus]|uniref:Vacuolar iron transporter n=1 Tax=Handroanthus impetiginosus TaxID=429701 RepID=A0A2G9GSN1_9LAMI|nr:putative membrane protein [Handroanthus impetiginosus]